MNLFILTVLTLVALEGRPEMEGVQIKHRVFANFDDCVAAAKEEPHDPITTIQVACDGATLNSGSNYGSNSFTAFWSKDKMLHITQGGNESPQP